MDKLKTIARRAGVALVVVALCMVPAFAFAQQGALTAGDIQEVQTAGTTPAKVAFTKQTTAIGTNTAYGKVVSNGKYYIASANDSRNIINPTKTKGLVCNTVTSPGSIWVFEYEKSSQSFFITNAKSGRALTVATNKNGEVGSPSVVYDAKFKRLDTQRWRVSASPTGYIIKPMLNLKTRLTFDKNGNAKVRKTTRGCVRRFWLLQTRGKGFLKTGTYSLSTRGGRMLTVPGMAISKSKKLRLASKQNDLSQVYDIAYKSNGYYTITNVNSGMVVTSAAGKTFQYPYKSGLDTQLWKAVLQKDGTVAFYNKRSNKSLMNRAWKISPATTGLNAVGRKALLRANKLTSKTRYAIMVDLTMHELFVFDKVNKKNSGGPWKLVKTTRCSSGSHSNWTGGRTSTVVGHHYTFGEFNCFYWTSLGSGFIHSLLYNSSSHPGRVTDGRLGEYISHGCIRVPIEYAKWIYDNCNYGTIASRYYS